MGSPDESRNTTPHDGEGNVQENRLQKKGAVKDVEWGGSNGAGTAGAESNGNDGTREGGLGNIRYRHLKPFDIGLMDVAFEKRCRLSFSNQVLRATIRRDRSQRGAVGLCRRHRAHRIVIVHHGAQVQIDRYAHIEQRQRGEENKRNCLCPL